jgi:uncharacterized membrane protein YdbT with pleckstrin-like domain
LSDVQIQTAGYGGAGSRGFVIEGRAACLSKEEAERIREELVQRANQSKNQWL